MSQEIMRGKQTGKDTPQDYQKIIFLNNPATMMIQTNSNNMSRQVLKYPKARKKSYKKLMLSKSKRKSKKINSDTSKKKEEQHPKNQNQEKQTQKQKYSQNIQNKNSNNRPKSNKKLDMLEQLDDKIGSKKHLSSKLHLKESEKQNQLDDSLYKKFQTHHQQLEITEDERTQTIAVTRNPKNQDKIKQTEEKEKHQQFQQKGESMLFPRRSKNTQKYFSTYHVKTDNEQVNKIENRAIQKLLKRRQNIIKLITSKSQGIQSYKLSLKEYIEIFQKFISVTKFKVMNPTTYQRIDVNDDLKQIVRLKNKVRRKIQKAVIFPILLPEKGKLNQEQLAKIRQFKINKNISTDQSLRNSSSSQSSDNIGYEPAILLKDFEKYYLQGINLLFKNLSEQQLTLRQLEDFQYFCKKNYLTCNYYNRFHYKNFDEKKTVFTNHAQLDKEYRFFLMCNFPQILPELGEVCEKDWDEKYQLGLTEYDHELGVRSYNERNVSDKRKQDQSIFIKQNDWKWLAQRLLEDETNMTNRNYRSSKKKSTKKKKQDEKSASKQVIKTPFSKKLRQPKPQQKAHQVFPNFQDLENQMNIKQYLQKIEKNWPEVKYLVKVQTNRQEGARHQLYANKMKIIRDKEVQFKKKQQKLHKSMMLTQNDCSFLK